MTVSVARNSPSLNETTLNAPHSLMSPSFRQPLFSQLFVTVRPGKMPLNPTGNDSWWTNQAVACSCFYLSVPVNSFIDYVQRWDSSGWFQRGFLDTHCKIPLLVPAACACHCSVYFSLCSGDRFSYSAIFSVIRSGENVGFVGWTFFLFYTLCGLSMGFMCIDIC